MPHATPTQVVLAVRTEHYVQQVSPLPFIGLPREEIERLHGAVEVLALDRVDTNHLPLSAYAAVHYNYAWLTGLDGPNTLGKRVPLYATGEPPLFLDDALHALARNELEAAGMPSAVPCDWRCAGLLHHDGVLALVYIVRLRQRWAESTDKNLRVVSNGELQTERKSFDAFGQLLIRNLPAL
jgi:hypothetical protein